MDVEYCNILGIMHFDASTKPTSDAEPPYLEPQTNCSHRGLEYRMGVSVRCESEPYLCINYHRDLGYPGVKCSD